MFILTKWSDVDIININQLRSLNSPVTKIQAAHTGRIEAKIADADLAHGLEVELLLARGAQVMLTANLWTEFGLVNSSMETIQDIFFKEDQGSPFVPIAVLIFFDNYKGSTIASSEGARVVLIAPI